MDKVGVATFANQETAESYLCNLPRGYDGHCYRSESGKWTVSYRACAHAVTDKEGFCLKCRTYVGQEVELGK